MSKTEFQSRQPKGIRIGGQFMQGRLPESGVGLTGQVNPITGPVNKEQLAHRHELFTKGGFVPGGVVASATTNDDVLNPQEWWDRSLAAGEYGDRGRSYTKMPDDFTPQGTAGQAMSGKRRTHRMRYSGAGVDLRMPSATSIRAFSKQNGNPTFDVPISVAMDDGPTTNNVWVRVTQTGPHSWKTTTVGVEGERAERIAESVSAVLEARRVTQGLREAGDLLQRRKAKVEAEGFELDQPDTATRSFIKKVGYDDATGTMGTAIGNKIYGHQVPRNVFEAVKQGGSPGKIFNLLVKGKQTASVVRCDQCKRYHASTAEHHCPTSHKKRSGVGLAYGRKARKRAAAAAEVLSAGTSAPPVAEPAAPAVDPRIAEIQSRWSEEANGPRRRGKDLYGPQGYTQDAAIALAPHTGEQYLPHMFERGGSNNGGIVQFEGASADVAAKLKDSLPKAALAEHQNGSPKVGELLGAAVRSPEQVELSGYLVPPDRNDERVSIDGLRFYDDDMVSALEAQGGFPDGYERRAIVEERLWRQAALRMGLPRRPEQMPEARLVSSPWNKDRKAIAFSWD